MSRKTQEERFLEAFDTYNEPLFRHCFFRISDRERALDLVQDTFTKAWKQVVEGTEVRNFRPFLYTILNNLIIDEYRKKKATSLDEILEGETVTEGDFDELKDESAESLVSVLDAKRVTAYVEQLPDGYKRVIMWRFIDDLSPKEISEMTGESENVISVRAHRALKRLRVIMDEHEKA